MEVKKGKDVSKGYQISEVAMILKEALDGLDNREYSNDDEAVNILSKLVFDDLKQYFEFNSGDSEMKEALQDKINALEYKVETISDSHKDDEALMIEEATSLNALVTELERKLDTKEKNNTDYLDKVKELSIVQGNLDLALKANKDLISALSKKETQVDRLIFIVAKHNSNK